jgi:hypothetical protein
MIHFLTLNILDREVVLKRIGEMDNRWQSDDDVFAADVVRRSWSVRCQFGPVQAAGWGSSIESATQDLDQKLRQLREWLNG